MVALFRHLDRGAGLSTAGWLTARAWDFTPKRPDVHLPICWRRKRQTPPQMTVPAPKTGRERRKNQAGKGGREILGRL